MFEEKTATLEGVDAFFVDEISTIVGTVDYRNIFLKYIQKLSEKLNYIWLSFQNDEVMYGSLENFSKVRFNVNMRNCKQISSGVNEMADIVKITIPHRELNRSDVLKNFPSGSFKYFNKFKDAMQELPTTNNILVIVDQLDKLIEHVQKYSYHEKLRYDGKSNEVFKYVNASSESDEVDDFLREIIPSIRQIELGRCITFLKGDDNVLNDRNVLIVDKTVIDGFEWPHVIVILRPSTQNDIGNRLQRCITNAKYVPLWDANRDNPFETNDENYE